MAKSVWAAVVADPVERLLALFSLVHFSLVHFSLVHGFVLETLLGALALRRLRPRRGGGMFALDFL
jgi:hypothetical protein